MEELDIIIEPELEFSLKKCGDVVPYGITPEERAKLAGIEENANNYTHPQTHPASILDVVDVVNGAENKFMNERGEMVAVTTSSIGVTGSQLYASTANSDVAGYKSLVGTPQPLETEIALTAKSSDGIVWGAKYLSAPFTEAVTIPATAYGFDYWRKVSAANGTSRKHLRVFLYRAGVETNIITPLASPDIEETEFTERQISYIFPELVLLAGDRIGIQEGFSTTHAANITLTYIVGDGRGWFMRLPLPLKHKDLTDKNSESAFQHVDTTTVKPTLASTDMVAIKDSVTGKMVLTPKNNLETDVVQNTGTSETDVMSQKAVTNELAKKHEVVVDYTHTGNKEVNIESIDFATGTITAIRHGFAVNNFVCTINKGLGNFPFSALPNGLNPFTGYFVINVTPDTFMLSASYGGAPMAISDKTTKDYSKWHLESIGNVNILGLSLRKFIIEFEGKSSGSSSAGDYLYLNGGKNYGAAGTVWFTDTEYSRITSGLNRSIFRSIANGDIWSYNRLEIDVTGKLASILINGYRIYSLTETTRGIVRHNNDVAVHSSVGEDVVTGFTQIGVFNGMNIKVTKIL